MATTTRQAVREYLIDHFGIGRRGTNSGTGTSEVIDDVNFGGHLAAEGIEVGCAIMCTLSNDGSAPEHEITRLSSKPKVTTGAFNVDPVFTAPLDAASTFDLLYRPFEYDGIQDNSVHAAIDQALRWFTWVRQLVPITMVNDGDMRSHLTTDWTTSNATLTKGVGLSYSGFLPERSLGVSASANDGYAATANIHVEPSESYYLEVTGFRSTSDGTLVLRNVSDSSNFTLSESAITRPEPTLLITPSVQMTSTTELVSARLQTDTSGNVSGWTNLIFRKNSAREFVLRDRPVRIHEIGRVFATTISDYGERGMRMVNDRYEVPREAIQSDAGIWQLFLRHTYGGYSLWYEEFTQPHIVHDTSSSTTLTMDHDADTTYIPVEELAGVAAYLLLEPLQDDERWARPFLKAARVAAKVRDAYQDLRVTVNNAQRHYSLPKA